MRALNEQEKRFIKVLKRNVSLASKWVNKMQNLTYSQEEKVTISNNMYKEAVKKTYETFRIKLSLTKEEFNILLKSEKYKIFWLNLHKNDMDIYQRMSLLVK